MITLALIAYTLFFLVKKSFVSAGIVSLAALAPVGIVLSFLMAFVAHKIDKSAQARHARIY